MARNISKAADNLITSGKAAKKRYQRAVDQFNQQLNPRQQRLFSAFRFLAAFTLLSGPFYFALNSGWNAAGIRSITASVSAVVLDVVGLQVSSAGSFVHGSEMVLDVTRDSTGWKSVLAFTALVLATGRPLRQTARGLIAGITALFAANVLRITTMFYAVTVYDVSYELLHTVLWRWGLTAAVLVTWMWWISDIPVRTVLYRFRTAFTEWRL